MGEIVGFGVLLLFFFQLLSEFVEGVYAFGLMGVDIPPEIAASVLLLAPVVLIPWRRERLQRWVRPLFALAVAARLTAPMLDTRGRMLVAGVGVAAMMMAWTLLLGAIGPRLRSRSRHLGMALAFAAGASALTRALLSGYDVTLWSGGRVFAWLLAIPALVWLVSLDPDEGHGEEPAQPTAFLRLAALAVGVAGVWTALYFAFLSPGVIARWTGIDYLPIVAVYGGSLVLFAALAWRRPGLLDGRRSGLLVALNVVLFAALFLTIESHQLAFPSSPEGYPFMAPLKPLWNERFADALLLLAPVLFVDFAVLVRAIGRARPSPAALGGGFAIAGFVMLALILGQILTSVYDYMPGVGPLFRDKFMYVTLAPFLLALCGVLAARAPAATEGEVPERVGFAPAALLVVLAVVAPLVAWSRAPSPTGITRPSARVVAYNIQQGYDASGSRNFGGQLDLMWNTAPDILGLIECDNSRIAGGNSDVVRFLADGLGMYSYRGPTTVAGTFGLALLSRAPIKNARTEYFYTQGEQTAAIVAEVKIGHKFVVVVVTHLGNDGPSEQVEDLLEAVGDSRPVIVMGDFNFKPGSEQHARMTSVLEDAWERRGAGPVGHEGRIDHMYLGGPLQLAEFAYIDEPASDHPAVYAELRPR